MKRDDTIEDIAGRMGTSCAFTKKILRKLLNNKDKLLIEIKEVINTHSFECIYEKAHELKGTFAYLKITEITDACVQIEQLAKQKQKDGYKLILAQIEHDVKRLESIINENLIL